MINGNIEIYKNIGYKMYLLACLWLELITSKNIYIQ